MSHPSHPEPPGETAGGISPTTSEIPVVRPSGTATRSLPPHPGARTIGAVPPSAPGTESSPAYPPEAPQATGPVDFVPGLPGAGTPPPPPVDPPPAAPPQGQPSSPAWPETLESDAPPHEDAADARAPRDRRAIARVGLAALALVLLQVGLTLDFGTESLWSRVTLWAAFVTLAAFVALLAFAVTAAPGGRLDGDSAWRIAAAGLIGLAVFWLLVVLPNADSDRGFLLTAALGALGGALSVSSRSEV